MFDDLKEFLKELIKKVVTSRLFALSAVFLIMFCVLVGRLFKLQIVEGEEYQDAYIALAEKVIKTASTRGNIYDRNGNVLAYNELAYSVTIQDIGAFKKDADWNSMLYELVTILNKHGETAQGSLELMIDHDGEVAYSTKTEAARKRFLRDLYGLKSVDELTDKDGDAPADVTARELFDKLKKQYKLEETKDRNGDPIEVPDDIALQMINIRYTMRFTAFQKYETTTIATNISDETMTDILEHSSVLPGVDIDESTIRVYNESLYFAPIVGYTGKVTTERLEELKQVNDDYELNDVVGRTGIESSMELELKGKKGSQTAYVDNVGRILNITDEVQPVAGNDIWLTLDLDLQKAIYNILERQLAGVLLKTIVNQEASEIVYTDSSNIKLPIKDAYFQLINNNVLSLDQFASEEASDVERQINAKYLNARARVENDIRNELMSGNATMMRDLSEEMQAYMIYIYTYLASDEAGVVLRDSIDTTSAEYQAWKNNAISLRDYLYYGIASNWIDTTKLNITSKYSNADDVFSALVDYVFQNLEEDREFTKKIYRYLINNNVVTGKELCLALYSQNVLAYDEEEVSRLRSSGDEYAFEFLMNKIRNIEITPAQLALDPCTASCVVTNVRTGEVMALVTYPSYDSNRISDPEYFAQLNSDQSLPLRNNATQTLKAPGSTFKPITAVAGLEEGAIRIDETINCTGIYEEVSNPIKCWKYPGFHGPLNIIGGIENSCNYFFSDLAHRLSLDEEGNYNAEKGLEVIRKYATMFGLDQPSGIEIFEAKPEISNTDPERSSMGQGTHNYTNVQLARYVTALANRGTVFDLSLIDKETDSKGNLVKDYTPAVHAQLEFAPSTWDAVQQGMRQVIANSSTKRIFNNLDVHIAGKTGTAQETEKRGNHAFFVSFAPYENPEIAVTVNIPNGYSSSNAAMAAKHVYRYYYKNTTLDDIMTSGALDASNERINGD
ncbi:penicillin-binding transpeptidase domain-containing protein [Clostridium transplantifaecale]|uniref:penicillin-binding transpeptidase domain-containing protein n=1 Tax=Clostridium transplantifaecale TaxID=2479838 RepID=UPI000F644693|nr:penicillin-binding transpeptidase domain-containing protein [Clostridium transplantifaecale]